MKNYILFGTLVCLVLFACNNTKKQEAEKAFDDFQTWLDSTQQNSGDSTLVSWQKIEAEYLLVKAKLDSTKENLSVESKQQYELRQKEFDNLQMKYKAAIDNTQVDANNKMNEIELWMTSKSDTTLDKTKETVSEIELEWDNFKAEFKEKSEELTEETIEKWNTLENRVNQWIEYDLKQNLQ